MQRFTMRVQLDEEAHRSLLALCGRTGMTHIAMMSRVLLWFSRQNQVVQAQILGGLSEETLAGLSKHLLKQMAGQGGKSKKSGPQGEGGRKGSGPSSGAGKQERP